MSSAWVARCTVTTLLLLLVPLVVALVLFTHEKQYFLDILRVVNQLQELVV